MTSFVGAYEQSAKEGAQVCLLYNLLQIPSPKVCLQAAFCGLCACENMETEQASQVITKSICFFVYIDALKTVNVTLQVMLLYTRGIITVGHELADLPTVAIIHVNPVTRKAH